MLTSWKQYLHRYSLPTVLSPLSNIHINFTNSPLMHIPFFFIKTLYSFFLLKNYRPCYKIGQIFLCNPCLLHIEIIFLHAISVNNHTTYTYSALQIFVNITLCYYYINWALWQKQYSTIIIQYYNRDKNHSLQS